MDSIKEAAQLVSQSKNICLIPSQNNDLESIASALALFYTLKELNKNANLIIENFPEKLNFLIPSLDFISTPKNFVISIPRNSAEISQVYYEKTEESLKIHLALDKGNIKKENISFYFSQAKPDMVIALGVKDLHSHLQNQLDSFGFILDSPILNIDSELPGLIHNGNKKFGKINLVEEKSISETILDLIKSLGGHLITKYIANCILTGLAVHYEHLKSAKTKPETFQLFAELAKSGADHHQIVSSLHKVNKKETRFFSKIFQSMETPENYEISVSAISSNEFQGFGEQEAAAAIEKFRSIGIESDLLVLWESHTSSSAVKGFLYSKNPSLINKIISMQGALQSESAKKDWVFILIQEPDINLAKEKILNQLNILKYNFS